MRASASSTLLLPALLLLPVTAWAAPPSDEGIGQGGFIYGAPGIIAIPVDDDVNDFTDPGYQWGFGGGYMWEPVRHFMITAGGAFEHNIVNYDNFGGPFVDIHTSFLRILPEARIGGGTRRVWGYGVLAPGMAIGVARFDSPGPDDSDSDVGFNLGLGGGVQGAVWRGLFLGGEVGADLMFFGDGDDQIDFDNDWTYMDIKFLIGWYFG